MRRSRPESVDGAESPVRAGCEPIHLEASGKRAVLLLHGFGDTPQTLSYVAPALYEAGLAVHAPLLPGHGRDVEDFARSTAEDWLRAAHDSLDALTERYEKVGVCGLSMGGALSVILAAERPDVRALVLIAPYVAMPPWLAAAAASHRVWGPLAGMIGSGSNRSIWDPVERSRNLGYGRATAGLINELWRVGRRARRALPRVEAPTLVLQSRQDNRIRPRVARRVFRLLGSQRKKLTLTEGAGHIVTVDYGRDAVIAEVREWFLAHLGAEARTAR